MSFTNPPNVGIQALADDLKYLASGTGATKRTLVDKLGDFKNAADYGVLPSNSAAANDTAFANLLAIGGRIFLQEGTYLISSTLIITQNGTSITGMGSSLTIISINTGGN